MTVTMMIMSQQVLLFILSENLNYRRYISTLEEVDGRFNYDSNEGIKSIENNVTLEELL